jgi:hypothetical protein
MDIHLSLGKLVGDNAVKRRSGRIFENVLPASQSKIRVTGGQVAGKSFPNFLSGAESMAGYRENSNP